MLDGEVKAGGVTATTGTVLLVDDDPQVLRAYGRILRSAGFDVVPAADGRAAREALEARGFDVVMSDITLPGADGIEVLCAARARDPDLPVVLMTAGGDLQSAVRAVELGALRYLLKPVEAAMLVETAANAVRLRQIASVKRRAFELYGSAAGREPERAARFDNALATLHMAYQPIVRWSTREVFAYEALVRNDEPTLCRPDALFSAAEALGRLFDLGRTIRRSVAATIEATGAPCTFVNLHPCDLEDEELFSPASPLARVASRVVLEVTERASLDAVRDVRTRLAALRNLGFRLAVDDLGAGYAGLTAFAQLQPEVVKLDMSLVRGVDAEPTKRKLVESMARLCRELGMLVVAEGVETRSERDALVAAGCDLLQGYYFARPGSAFPAVDFERAAA